MRTRIARIRWVCKGTTFDREEWATGVHSLTCKHGPARLARHNDAMHGGICFLKSAYNATIDTSQNACHIDSKECIDFTAATPFSSNGKTTTGFDATVRCAACPSNISLQAAQDASHVTKMAEREKAAKHAFHCKVMGNGYCTMAMTTYGGIGKDFYKNWIDPHFKKKIAREKAEGGTGFVAIGEKQRFLDDMSLRIARGNAGMVLAAAVAA